MPSKHAIETNKSKMTSNKVWFIFAVTAGLVAAAAIFAILSSIVSENVKDGWF